MKRRRVCCAWLGVPGVAVAVAFFHAQQAVEKALKASPERALELLRQLQRHRVHLADEQTVVGLSTISAEQAELFTSLKLPRPSTKNL